MNNNEQNGGLRRNPGRRSSMTAQRNKKRKIIIAVLIAALVVIWALVIAMLAKPEWFRGGKKPANTTPKGSESVSVTEPVTTDPVTTDPPVVTDPPVTTAPVVTYKNVTMSADRVHEGDLILINYKLGFPFVAPDGLEDSLKKIYGTCPGAYVATNSSHRLRSDVLDAFNDMMEDFSTQSGRGDAQVRLTYRTPEEQQPYFDKYGASGSAYPGYSEHHTGTAVDLNVYRRATDTDEGGTYKLSDFDVYEWIYDNCAKYGFILRYPASKTAVTGVDYDTDHFRYVGVAHATYMTENNLCLEEYLAKLQGYTADGEHLLVKTADHSYEVYYVPAAADNADTEVPVPEKLPYTISGNNYDGFVVTVTLD